MWRSANLKGIAEFSFMYCFKKHRLGCFTFICGLNQISGPPVAITNLLQQLIHTLHFQGKELESKAAILCMLTLESIVFKWVLLQSKTRTEWGCKSFQLLLRKDIIPSQIPKKPFSNFRNCLTKHLEWVIAQADLTVSSLQQGDG